VAGFWRGNCVRIFCAGGAKGGALRLSHLSRVPASNPPCCIPKRKRRATLFTELRVRWGGGAAIRACGLLDLQPVSRPNHFNFILFSCMAVHRRT